MFEVVKILLLTLCKIFMSLIARVFAISVIYLCACEDIFGGILIGIVCVPLVLLYIAIILGNYEDRSWEYDD